MKKSFTAFIAIIMTLSLVFSFAACGKKDETKTTAPGETTTIGDTSAPEDTTIEGETTTLEETTAVGETTQVGETTTAAPGKSAPSTTAEIVAYYNAAANKVKTDKPGYTLTTTNVIGEITSSSGLISGLAGRIVPMFSTDPVVTTAPKGDNGIFPVKGQSYGSKLEASSLKNATIVDKGSVYEITLNFKDEKLPDLPADITKTRHGQAFNVLSSDDVYKETDKFKLIARVESFAPTYSGSYIKCKIEKSTGNLSEATYYCVNTSVIKAKVGFSNIDATVPFGNKEVYKLNY
jgi:hypothetical protein